MALCAACSSGLLLFLAPNHPMRGTLRLSLLLDRRGTGGFLHIPVVLIDAYAEDSEVGSRKPFPTSPQFRRINSYRSYRLVIVDPLSPESSNLSIFGPLYVVPPENISPTLSQLDIHLGSLKKDIRYQFTDGCHCCRSSCIPGVPSWTM
jgi:hypothetical protein